MNTRLRLPLVVYAMILAAACGGDHALPTTPTPSNTPAAPTPVAAALSGTYRMLFSADPKCTTLPAVARARTYSATVAGPLITLGNATFGSPGGGYNWQSLYAKSSGDDVQLYFQDPPIWELLSADQYVVIFGIEASGSVRVLPATLPFEGDFRFCADPDPDSYPECEVPEIVCRSANHQLIISRQ